MGNHAGVIITIDGTAGSGKTTLGRALASHFGFYFIGSGLLYRAISAAVVRAGIAPTDSSRIANLLADLELDATFEDREMSVTLDGQPMEDLRSEAVNRTVAQVAAEPRVRSVVTALLHQIASQDCVVEGRDIGTAVFPNSPFQIYLDAGLEVREARRACECKASDCIAVRDRLDQERSFFPLAIPEGAFRIDTGIHDIQSAFDIACSELMRRGLVVAKGEKGL